MQSKLGTIAEGSFKSRACTDDEKQQKVVLSCDIVPRLPQNNFKVSTYDKDAHYLSFVDQKIKENEKKKEEEERQRELRKILKAKENRHLLGRVVNSPQSPNFDILQLRKQSVSSQSELLSQLNKDLQ